MIGASSSALFKASNDRVYVVSLQDFLLSNDWLASEFIARKLAYAVGLPVPDVELIQVDQWLIDHSLEMSQNIKPWLLTQPLRVKWHAPSQHKRRRGGVQLGSRYLVAPVQGNIFDYFPEKMLSRVRNLDAFAAVLAFDIWTNMTEPRRAVFWKTTMDTLYSVAFVDVHARLLPAPISIAQRTADPGQVGLYIHKGVYQHITGWHDFESIVSSVERSDRRTLENIVSEIPPCWNVEPRKLSALLRVLEARKATLGDLLSRYLVAMPHVFPNWRDRRYGPAREPAPHSCELGLQRRIGCRT